ncbi:AAA family ATPase [uncultured Deinococcus sp.]|uniref:AAA family ATPase n=1 Tax=uncultured Deinococcus sp. TaxID=158789 RepID=UPI00258AD31C|nr:AAA family ATPase [uncultured Deinococcus sp.]
MPYLTNFTAQNFKAFGEGASAPIRPVTLLFGANSAGKSSFLHALQLYAELLTTRRLHPAGLPLGDWTHGRRPGTAIHFEAEVRLLPMDVGTYGELSDGTETISLGLKLTTDLKGTATTGYDTEARLDRLEVKVNGQPGFAFGGKTYVEPATKLPVPWTGLALEEVDWDLPEVSGAVEKTVSDILRVLGAETNDPQNRVMIGKTVRSAWQRAFLVRTSDLCDGRARMLRSEEREDGHGTPLEPTYRPAHPPEISFIFAAVNFGPGRIRQAYARIEEQFSYTANPDDSGAELHTVIQAAFRGHHTPWLRVSVDFEDPADLQESIVDITENLDSYREQWTMIQEISTMLAFGLEDFTHALTKFLGPVLRVMETLQVVGPVRTVGETTGERQDSWQALLEPPATRERVNTWLAHLGMAYEVIPARLISEEQLSTATTQATIAAERETAAKLVLILDETIKAVGLTDAQGHSLRTLLRQRVQEDHLGRALGLTDPQRDAIFDGLSSRLRESISWWFPEKPTSILPWPLAVDLRLLPSIVDAAPPRTDQTSTLLKLRDRRSGLLLADTDLGVGVSQLLPVLARLATPGLALVEQPELHVHPALQADLADIVIEAANLHGVTLVLETHSEHLILRLLRRIRDTSDGTLQHEGLRFDTQDLSVLFVDPAQADQGATLRHLPINEEGEVVGRWPRGFFADRGEDLL